MIAVNIKEGDELTGGGNAVVSVADLSRMIMDVEVDEMYVSSLVPGMPVTISASYDGGRSWETLGQVIGGDGQTRGYLLHLRPRRCRQVRLRLQGTGRCRVFSMSAVYEKGSDGP